MPFLSAVSEGGRVPFGILEALVFGFPDLVRATVLEFGRMGEGLGSVRGRAEGLIHERVVRRCLRGRSSEDVMKGVGLFVSTVLSDSLRDDAWSRIDYHRDRGHHLVMASASLEIYVRPLALALGFHEAVGTRLEVAHGVFTGRFEGLPCWGMEKLRRTQEVIRPLGEMVIHAYGNGPGDRPLLAAAHHAFPVR